MCGILGVLPSVPSASFRRGLQLLQHRGPDGEGIWQDSQQRISLGHRRLAILDLSDAGKQPMRYGGRYTITFNGEIYNYVELRQELEGMGHQFHTHTDTEVLVAGYQQWKDRLFHKLNGMWAFAIWDEVEEKLILSRDRFGQKPLYYAEQNGRFIFASEMKALVPFMERLEVARNFKWMQEHLFQYEPTEHCLFEDMKRFPMGSWGVWQHGKMEIRPYWETLSHVEKPPKGYRAQVERFRELFLDACKIRMRADVPLGTALSGGVDSSATICSMAHIAKNYPDTGFLHDWQHAFVASMPNTPLDETKYAKIITDHLQIPATFVEIDPVKGIADLEHALYQFEELYITSPIPMLATYEAARQNGVYVTLDGHGADELFCGYDNFLFRTFYDCGLNPLAIQDVLRIYRELAPPNEPQFKKPHYDYREYLKFITHYPDFSHLKPYLKEEIKKVFAKKKPTFAKGNAMSSTEELGRFNQELYQLFHHDNLPTLLRNYDRYSMTHGVEIRMPFLDHRLVTYAFSLPWDRKIGHGYTKRILRDAMRPFVPKEVLFRKWKMGFQSPIVDWLKGAWKEYFLDTVHSTAFRESAFVDGDQVGAEIERVIRQDEMTYREGELAYAAISPFLWEKTVLKGFRELVGIAL